MDIRLKRLRFYYFNEFLAGSVGRSLFDLPSKTFVTKAGDPAGHQFRWKNGIFPSVRTVLKLKDELGDDRFVYAHPLFPLLQKWREPTCVLEELREGNFSDYLVEKFGEQAEGYNSGRLHLLDRAATEAAAIQIAIRKRHLDDFENGWKCLASSLTELIGTSQYLFLHKFDLIDSARYSLRYPSNRIFFDLGYYYTEIMSLKHYCENFGYWRDIEWFCKSRRFYLPVLRVIDQSYKHRIPRRGSDDASRSVQRRANTKHYWLTRALLQSRMS